MVESAQKTSKKGLGTGRRNLLFLGQMPDDPKNQNRAAILQVLQRASGPLFSAGIAAELRAKGVDLNDRSVRIYLNELVKSGFCKTRGQRGGHQITQAGSEEVRGATIINRIGFMSAQLDALTYRMDFDLTSQRGSVVVNVSLVSQDLFERHLDQFCEVFAKGYSMGTLVGLLPPGEKLESAAVTVPAGHFGVCTVASVTLNGILLRHGIPVRSLFSGLLELVDGKPTRVAELIAYDSTTVDPLQLFIDAGMTNYLGAIANGNGRIGIAFREVPAASHEQVVALAARLCEVGLGAFMEVGAPDRALLNMPVSPGSCGLLVIGGLNPVAVFVESGHRVRNLAMSALIPCHQLFHFSQLGDRMRGMRSAESHE
jgi:repressor of nif and glnA expression